MTITGVPPEALPPRMRVCPGVAYSTVKATELTTIATSIDRGGDTTHSIIHGTVFIERVSA